MADFIVKNFQSLESAKIRCEGFTLLIGETASGKSAFLRALKAATTNRFKIGQVRNGTDFSEILVRWAPDGQVLRVRRPHTGSPIVNLGELTFSKLNRSIPVQVEEYNNFGSIEVNGDSFSLNFFDQFDKPLLLEFSQKKVMEILSASKSIDELNVLNSALARKREQNRGAFRSVDAILIENNALLSLLRFDEQEISPKVSEMNETWSDLQDLHSSQSLLESLQTLLERKESLEKKISLINQIKEIGTDYLLEIEVHNIKCVGLVELIERSEELDNRMSYLQMRKKTLALVVENLQEKIGLRTVEVSVDSLKNLLDRQENLQTQIDNLVKVVDGHQCPLCGNKIE